MTDFDPTKLYLTRDGHKVGIYCTDAPGPFPIQGRILYKNRHRLREWTEKGMINPYVESHDDIINIPEPPPKPRVWYISTGGAPVEKCYSSAISALEATVDRQRRFLGRFECIETIELTPAVRAALEKEGLL